MERCVLRDVGIDAEYRIRYLTRWRVQDGSLSVHFVDCGMRFVSHDCKLSVLSGKESFDTDDRALIGQPAVHRTMHQGVMKSGLARYGCCIR